MWKTVLIWVVWLGLVLYWLTPEMNTIKDKINQHNTEIRKIIEE